MKEEVDFGCRTLIWHIIWNISVLLGIFDTPKAKPDIPHGKKQQLHGFSANGAIINSSRLFLLFYSKRKEAYYINAIFGIQFWDNSGIGATPAFV